MSVRIPGGRPTAATLRFLLALVRDGGVSDNAQQAVGSWDPIKTAMARGWARQEPRPGDEHGRVRYVLLPAGRAIAYACDPNGYADALPTEHRQAQLDASATVNTANGFGKVWKFEQFQAAVAAFNIAVHGFTFTVEKDFRVVITTDKYRILVNAYPGLNDDLPHENRARVYTDHDVLRAESADLVTVETEIDNLGDLQNCPPVRDGGGHPEVDALYQRQHQAYGAASEKIAREILPILRATGLFTVYGGDDGWEKVAGKAGFDRYAGGDSSSYGVVYGDVVLDIRPPTWPVQQISISAVKEA